MKLEIVCQTHLLVGIVAGNGQKANNGEGKTLDLMREALTF